MDHARELPALRFEVERPPAPTEPLRSDVGGFVGRTRRGPVRECVRIEGWPDYAAQFGGIDGRAVLPYAARGYFENGGQVAHFVRLLGEGHSVAVGTWTIGPPGPRGFALDRYEVLATSPGTWANGCTIRARFWIALGEGARVDLEIVCEGEPVEYLANLAVDRLEDEIAGRSRLVRISPAPGASVPTPGSGPRHHRWDDIVLQHGSDGAPPDLDEYTVALRRLGDEPEVAIVAAPDLYGDLVVDDALEWLVRATADARTRLDRMIVVDWRLGDDELAQLAALREHGRAAAAYAPNVFVRDPVGDALHPLRAVPPSGHVAGAISKLDRERGAHYSPANTGIVGVYDLDAHQEEPEQARLLRLGVNPLLCRPGRGVQLWGARTLVDARLEREHVFLAHRRLVHRLVRAFRRVAEPLVFQANEPTLWLALARAMTTILVEVWRRGGLVGERAEQAFFVRCDETTNPPTAVETGACVCEIGIAPAAPMEFITIRIGLRRDGTLEVT